MSDQALVVPLAEAAEMLCISTASAYRLVREGRFPVRAVKVGGKIMVSRQALETFVNGPAEVA